LVDLPGIARIPLVDSDQRKISKKS